MSVQIVTADILCVYPVAYCIQETGIDTIGGGWLSWKTVVPFPFSVKVVHPELALNFWLWRIQKQNEVVSWHQIFFVVIKHCSQTGFLLLTNFLLLLLTDEWT